MKARIHPTTYLLALGVVIGMLLGRVPGVWAQVQRPELITPETEHAIKAGLKFLSSTQGAKGDWRNGGGYGQYPCVMTSLAGLALMASGSTPVEGEYAKNIRKAEIWVMSKANHSGVISDLTEEQQCMYGHGFAMLFLSQVYGMEQDPEQRKKIKKILEAAAVLTGRAQSVDGGWLYTPDSGGDEGSVTVTQIQGLRAVRNAGIKVDKQIIDKACQYIQKSANPDGGIRYTARGGGESRPAITAAACATMYNAGAYENPVAKKALEYTKKLLRDNKGNMQMVFQGHEFYSMMYISEALYLTADEKKNDENSKNWTDFFPAIRENLVKTQNKSDGSWQGDGVGTSYGTAIALLILQLPYKVLPILQR